jgi:hypothetical protein
VDSFLRGTLSVKEADHVSSHSFGLNNVHRKLLDGNTPLGVNGGKGGGRYITKYFKNHSAVFSPSWPTILSALSEKQGDQNARVQPARKNSAARFQNQNFFF